jgi:hypothetical protein
LLPVLNTPSGKMSDNAEVAHPTRRVCDGWAFRLGGRETVSPVGSSSRNSRPHRAI